MQGARGDVHIAPAQPSAGTSWPVAPTRNLFLSQKFRAVVVVVIVLTRVVLRVVTTDSAKRRLVTSSPPLVQTALHGIHQRNAACVKNSP